MYLCHMNKYDIKKCILIGVVSGIVTAFTSAGIIYSYIEISAYYRRYKNEQAIKAGARSHCERESLKKIKDIKIKQNGDK